MASFSYSYGDGDGYCDGDDGYYDDSYGDGDGQGRSLHDGLTNL